MWPTLGANTPIAGGPAPPRHGEVPPAPHASPRKAYHRTSRALRIPLTPSHTSPHRLRLAAPALANLTEQPRLAAPPSPPRAPSSSLRPRANHPRRSPVPCSSYPTRTQAESGTESPDFVTAASPAPPGHHLRRASRSEPQTTSLLQPVRYACHVEALQPNRIPIRPL